jgi:hypothetical protein
MSGNSSTWRYNMKFANMAKYMRYSNISVIVSLNPLGWRVWPWCRDESSSEWGAAEHTYAAGFLCVTVRIWIDCGDW